MSILDKLMLFNHHPDPDVLKGLIEVAENNGIAFSPVKDLTPEVIRSVCDHGELHLLVVHCEPKKHEDVWPIVVREKGLRILFCSTDPSTLIGLRHHEQIGRSRLPITDLRKDDAFVGLLEASEKSDFDRQFGRLASILPPHYLSAALVAVQWLQSLDSDHRNDALIKLQKALGESFWREARMERDQVVFDGGWKALAAILHNNGRLSNLASKIESLIE